MNAIQTAYLANIAILLPISVPTLLRLYRTDQGKFTESSGWRALVGALWTGILVLSALGLRDPLGYSPVLLLQLIYKSLWLLVYALPLALRREWNLIPWGITGSFLAIVMIWPWIIPWSHLLRS
jgi:hypothetical protein